MLNFLKSNQSCHIFTQNVKKKFRSFPKMYVSSRPHMQSGGATYGSISADFNIALQIFDLYLQRRKSQPYNDYILFACVTKY